MSSWGIRANLDPLGAAMDKLRDNARKQGKEFGRKEAGFFLRIMKRVSWESAPSRATIQAVYDGLVASGRRWYMVRRGRSRTPEQELARRLRARGTFARRWFIASITQPSRWRIRILLVDRADYSDRISARDGTIKRAKEKTLRGWKSKLDRMAKRISNI